jgi:Cu/Ag efflux pump CusA
LKSPAARAPAKSRWPITSSWLEKLKADHPDIEITEAFNFVDPVIENYEGSMKLLIEGALLAVLVVWLFLRDGRATFGRPPPCRCRRSRPSP